MLRKPSLESNERGTELNPRKGVILLLLLTVGKLYLRLRVESAETPVFMRLRATFRDLLQQPRIARRIGHEK